jgi:murein DD-endopeptidase MepM/ murein hydrolase activator NlpD
MIAVLRRQLVKKRAPHPKRLSPEDAAALSGRARRAQGGVSPRFKIRGTKGAGARAAGSGPLARQGAKSARKRINPRSWITAGLSAVLLLGIFVPAIAMRGASLPRPVLPVTADAVQELYRVVLPEEEASPQAGSASPLLSSLKVNRYTIKKGESLSQVASRLGLNMDTLISFNGIRDARSLAVGAVLRYPNADGLKYTVRRGDTLDKISRSFSVSLESILDWNQLSTSVITVGQELFIPGARMSVGDLNKALGNLFVWPVVGRISSRFGDRNNPFTGVEKLHNGLDIVAKANTSIGAAMAGRVASVGFNAVYGRYIIIKHVGTGFQTMYAHLNKTSVSRDQNVAQGQKIGELGNTGMSTGAHLHFSIFKNNEPVDPLAYLK